MELRVVQTPARQAAALGSTTLTPRRKPWTWHGAPPSPFRPADSGIAQWTGTSNPGHTGLYIGNGYYINAPQSGEPVRVDDLSKRGPDFAGVLRTPAS